MAIGGCKPANQLVGTWKLNGMAGLTMQFNNNGTFEAKMDSPKGNLDEQGTYSTDGKTVTITVTKYDVSSSDPNVQKMIDANKDQKDAALKKAKPMAVPITWKSDKEFSMGGVSTSGFGSTAMGTFTRE